MMEDETPMSAFERIIAKLPAHSVPLKQVLEVMSLSLMEMSAEGPRFGVSQEEHEAYIDITAVVLRTIQHLSIEAE